MKRRIGLFKKVAITVMGTCLGGIGMLCGETANDITCQADENGVVCNGQLHIPFTGN